MAARRLLIIMLVLLGISTLAAALVGNRSISEDGTGSTIASETESTTTEDQLTNNTPAGKDLTFNLRVGGEKVKVVRAQVGDQIALLVRSRKPDLVEIPAFGQVEAASPQVPASFYLLATEPGEFGIRLVDSKRVVAQLEIREREKGASKEAKEPSK